MSELRERMIRDMTVRGFSSRTHEAYIRQVVGLARYYHQLNMVWRKNAGSPVLREFLDEVRRVGARGIRPRAKPTTGTRRAAL